jgi:hypothetical protein
MKDIIIEIYKDGDEIAINDLFNCVFNQKRDLKEWKWKFREGPIDTMSFTVLANDKDKTVGQYPCIACYLKYQDKILKIAQPVDNLVHKDYRGGAKGAQVEMFLKEEEIWRDNGIDMAFGFPNREAYIVGKRLLKYKDLIKIENLYKRLSLRLALKNRIKVPFLANFGGWISSFITRFLISLSEKSIKGVKYKWIRSFDERIDPFWQKIQEQYEIMVQRDFKYLNWRYCKKPNNDYRILQAERNGCIIGILVVKYEDHGDARIGFIMECLAVKEVNLMENLLKRGLVFLSQNRADYVIFRLSSSDRVKDIAGNAGFIIKEDVWGSNVVYKTYSSNVDDSILKDPSMWHISFGDADSL